MVANPIPAEVVGDDQEDVRRAARLLRIGEDDDEGESHKVTEKSHRYLFPTFGGTLASFGAADRETIEREADICDATKTGGSGG
jgi:hypothetical protein